MVRFDRFDNANNLNFKDQIKLLKTNNLKLIIVNKQN